MQLLFIKQEIDKQKKQGFRDKPAHEPLLLLSKLLLILLKSLKAKIQVINLIFFIYTSTL